MRLLACKFELDKVNASGWLNEKQVERKSKTCDDLGVRLARAVDVDMLNAVKSALADVSRVSPSSEQKSMGRSIGRLCRQIWYA